MLCPSGPSPRQHTVHDSTHSAALKPVHWLPVRFLETRARSPAAEPAQVHKLSARTMGCSHITRTWRASPSNHSVVAEPEHLSASMAARVGAHFLGSQRRGSETSRARSYCKSVVFTSCLLVSSTTAPAPCALGCAYMCSEIKERSSFQRILMPANTHDTSTRVRMRSAPRVRSASRGAHFW